MSLVDVARVAETPSYVYDLDAMAAEARELREAFGSQRHRVCFAVKANSAGAVLRALAGQGCGADVVSGAELVLARACGVPSDAIVFSGVAKLGREIDFAIAEGVTIQVESVEEIGRIAERASDLGARARISIRINPAIDSAALATHANIATGHDEAKFGVLVADLPAALDAASRSDRVSLVGLSAHIGSQLTDTAAYVDAARALFAIAREVRQAHPLSFVDTGGGFGIDYGAGCGARPADFVRAVCRELAHQGLGDVALYVEPGRSLVATHGVLLTRVIQRKVSGDQRWLMIDAGMNDLLRPALYQARHRVVPVETSGAPCATVRVVGPVCESSDDFGAHDLPEGGFSLAAVLDAGAYGYTMASRYNGRALPAEVFISGGRIASITAREDWSAWAGDRARAGA